MVTRKVKPRPYGLAAAAILALAAVAAGAEPAEKPASSKAEMRTWTDVSGKFQVQARLLKVEEDEAHLEKAAGKTIVVPLERLSEADRAFLAALGRGELASKPATDAIATSKPEQPPAKESPKPNVAEAPTPSPNADPAKTAPPGSGPPGRELSADAKGPPAKSTGDASPPPPQTQPSADPGVGAAGRGAGSLAWIGGGAAAVVAIGILAVVGVRATRRRTSSGPQTTASPSRTRNTEKAKECVERGKAAVSAKDYDRAIRCFDEAIQHDPEWAEAWYQRAVALKVGRLGHDMQEYVDRVARGLITTDESTRVVEDVRKSYRRAVELDPHNGVYRAAAEAFEGHGSSPAPARPAASASGASVSELIAAGDALMKEKRLREALQKYDEAIAKDPRAAAAWCAKGICLANCSQSEGDPGLVAEAKRCFQKAHELEPGNTQYEFWANLGKS